MVEKAFYETRIASLKVLLKRKEAKIRELKMLGKFPSLTEELNQVLASGEAKAKSVIA